MNNTFYQVLLKKGSRTVQSRTVQSRDEADRICQEWYAEGDGHTFEVQDKNGPVEQVLPHIEPDRYLTQTKSRSPFGP
jgi:hypothetical protein